MDKRLHDAFYNADLSARIEDTPVKVGDPNGVTLTDINIMAMDPELNLPYCGTVTVFYAPKNLAVMEDYDLIQAITMMSMVEPVKQKVLCDRIGQFLKNKMDPYQYIVSMKCKHMDIINRRQYEVSTMAKYADREMAIDPLQMQYFISKEK